MIDLSGNWQYALQFTDDFEKEKWFRESEIRAESQFTLPGSNTDNGIGEKIQYDGQLSEENVHRLREKHSYIGKIWLRKKVVINEFSSEKAYFLYLERVMWRSSIWINGNFVGTSDSLSTAHKYNITEYASKELLIILEIDNRDIHEINTTPSAYTEETQTIWNGAIGNLEIIESELIRENINLQTNISKKSIEVSYQFETSRKIANLGLEVKISRDGKVLKKQTIEYHKNSGTRLAGTQNIALEDIALWDEFSPTLYELEYRIKDGQRILEKGKRSFGFREWQHSAQQLTINGKKVFLRGTIDCCIFPLTGYPPMDKLEWNRIFKVIKQYGLNHVRFHSWCPPEAAFEVADELGLYLQIEGPIWLDDWMPYMLGDKPDHYTFFQKESEAIINNYGHHPSFCFFSCGNELRGDYVILRNIVDQCKQLNNGILYTLTTNWDRVVDTRDDLFIAQTVDKLPVRGQYDLDKMVENTEMNFSNAINKRNVPVISHEVGQYSIYPNIKEIEKYKGNLEPINFIAIRDDLDRKGMLEMASDFTHVSGKLAMLLYKDEIEAALRTEKMGGYQLLGLNDFTGQSTATVGLLDAFWEDKGILTSDEYKQYSSEVVPLVELKKRIFSDGEKIEFKLLVANYFKKLEDVKVVIKIRTKYNQLIMEKSINIDCINTGLQTISDKVTLEPFDQDLKNTALKLSVEITNQPKIYYVNQWDIWYYKMPTKTNNNILLSNTLNEKILNRVRHGEKLLLTPKREAVKGSDKTVFFPVFWSPVHFKSKANCGLLINEQHPLFKYFPSDKYANYQWKSLIESAYSIPFDKINSNFKPITQVVPNFFNNKKGFMLGEFKYGDGQVLISSVDLSGDNLVQKVFKNELLKYMMSNEFLPDNVIETDQLISLFYKKGEQNSLIDLAANMECSADSVLDDAHRAKNAVMGNKRGWQPLNNQSGHWWKVDMGAIKTIKRIEVALLSKGTYYYNISISDDDKEYETIINKSIDTKKELVVEDDLSGKARFIKISYGDASEGADIGHQSVRIF